MRRGVVLGTFGWISMHGFWENLSCWMYKYGLMCFYIWETTGSIEFTLDTPLSFSAGEEKTLLLVADFNIPKDQTAQIEITKSKFKLETETDVIGLPMKSKEFTYKCEEGDYTCLDGDDDGGSCAVTAVDDTNAGIFAVIAALLFVLGSAFTRKNAEK